MQRYGVGSAQLLTRLLAHVIERQSQRLQQPVAPTYHARSHAADPGTQAKTLEVDSCKSLEG